MKTRLLIPFLLSVLLLCQSCSDKSLPSQTVGTVSHYPSFLWVKEKTQPIERTLYTDFSRDAKLDSTTFASFILTPDPRVNTPEIELFIDGILCENGRFTIPSSADSVNIRISLPEKTEQGSYTYTLRLYDSDLNRINNTILSDTYETIDLGHWIVKYETRMNPLAKWLMVILLCLFACLLLWFAVLRPTFFPHFRHPVKTVSIKQGLVTVAAIRVKFKGAKEIIITSDSKIQRQSSLSRLFTGRTEYVITCIQSSVSIRPDGNRRMFIIAKGYTVTPSTNPPVMGVVTAQNGTTVLTIA